MVGMKEDGDVASPRIFAPTSLTLDDSQLCFNRSYFSRSDFDVERFMNLARRRAGLKQIQSDLRLYLKSVQHSMIELINDDYADFVHLSSNLVGLEESIDKINSNLQASWNEFEKSSKESVDLAERIEIQTSELKRNRIAQSSLSARISFLSALQRLARLLKRKPTSPPPIIWLEKIASCVVDVTSYDLDHLKNDSKEELSYNKVLLRLENLLCEEGVRSASTDCLSLPLILSLLSLIRVTHCLTARLVSDVIFPRIVRSNPDQYQLLISAFDGVVQMRNEWKTTLGTQYNGYVKTFLEQSLLTFISTFIDKSMATVAVPSDTALFHRCFIATQEFIDKWPVTKQSWRMLKEIRDKFNMVVYFKLETNKFLRKIEAEMTPEVLKIHTSEKDDGSEEMRCELSVLIIQSIYHIWDDNVFLYPLSDRLWELTVRLLTNHLNWAKEVVQYVSVDGNNPTSLPSWQLLLYVKKDLKTLHSKIFDLSLEQIWTKLRDMGVDSSPFGQCLTRMGSLVESQCILIDSHVNKAISDIVRKELDGVMDIPKQYRWTKKALPTQASTYITSAHASIDTFRDILHKEEEENSDDMISDILLSSYTHLVEKAKQVLESVEATGSSLSRLKRKGTGKEGDGASDEDKIKAQIFWDLSSCSSRMQIEGIKFDGFEALITRSRPDQFIIPNDDKNVSEWTAIRDGTA